MTVSPCQGQHRLILRRFVCCRKIAGPAGPRNESALHRKNPVPENRQGNPYAQHACATGTAYPPSPIAQLHRRSPWFIRPPGMRKESVADDIEILVTRVNNLHDRINTQDTDTARAPLEEARLIWNATEQYRTDALCIQDSLYKSRNHNPKKAVPREEKVREVLTVLRTIGVQAYALLQQHGLPGAASGSRPAQTAQATANDGTERASADRNSLHDSAGLSCTPSLLKSRGGCPVHQDPGLARLYSMGLLPKSPASTEATIFLTKPSGTPGSFLLS